MQKKSKKIIFYPFLISIFPVLMIFEQNIGRINFDELILPIIILMGFSIGIYFVLKNVLKNREKAALVITLILFVLFSYGHLYYLLNANPIEDFDISRNRYLLPIFGISLLVSCFVVIKSKKKFDNISQILNVISLVLIIVSISNIGLTVVNASGCEDCRNKEIFYETMDFSKYFEDHSFLLNEKQNFPDVYYLILDEYARNDALLEYHKYDNSEFKNYLLDKGFHIAENSLANYPLSIQSIPSTMNLQYINFLQDEIGENMRNYRPLNEKDYGLYSNNMVIKNFKEMGYKIITFNIKSLHLHENPLADYTFCHREKYLLDNSLFDALARTSIFGYFVERWAEDDLRQATVCALENFSESGEIFEEPVFVWGHVMLPHPPWIFGPNGEKVIPGQPLLLADNPESRDSGWEPKRQYIQQVEFANMMAKQSIEKILEKNQNVIIIIQGDHGTAWDLNWEDPSASDVSQRLRNFDAIYLPDEDKRLELMDDRSLVNTFRIIFNLYYGSDYEILENKLYWSTNALPYNFKDVTNMMKQIP